MSASHGIILYASYDLWLFSRRKAMTFWIGMNVLNISNTSFHISECRRSQAGFLREIMA